jgi:hypothetical protein
MWLCYLILIDSCWDISSFSAIFIKLLNFCNYMSSVFYWMQIHGFQEDNLVRSKAHCWASRPTYKRFSAMGWVLSIDQGCPHQTDGISFEENSDSWQAQGRGLLLCESPRMPPGPWFPAGIMMPIAVYILFTLYHSFANAIDSYLFWSEMVAWLQSEP